MRLTIQVFASVVIEHEQTRNRVSDQLKIL